MRLEVGKTYKDGHEHIWRIVYMYTDVTVLYPAVGLNITDPAIMEAELFMLDGTYICGEPSALDLKKAVKC